MPDTANNDSEQSLGTVKVWFQMPATYTQVLDLDYLAMIGAPVDNTDRLWDWLEAEGWEYLADTPMLLDTDPGAIEISDVEVSA